MGTIRKTVNSEEYKMELQQAMRNKKRYLADTRTLCEIRYDDGFFNIIRVIVALECDPCCRAHKSQN
jgi:hypothetical protein